MRILEKKRLGNGYLANDFLEGIFLQGVFVRSVRILSTVQTIIYDVIAKMTLLLPKSVVTSQ